jgi:hypothetical protein
VGTSSSDVFEPYNQQSSPIAVNSAAMSSSIVENPNSSTEVGYRNFGSCECSYPGNDRSDVLQSEARRSTSN